MMMKSVSPAKLRGEEFLYGAWQLAPGLLLVSVITLSVCGLRDIGPFAAVSPMMLAIALGILFGNLTGFPGSSAHGINFSGKRVLRVAVALLGLQVTFQQLLTLGAFGIFAACAVVFGTYFFTVWLAARMGVSRALGSLIGCGTAVCGASAIAASNAVLQADDEDVSYAIGCITLFGTVAMILFPLVQGIVVLPVSDYGLWAGLSIHEVAQVVVAGFQVGEESGESAVIAKLARVGLLAPLMILLSASLLSGGPARGGATGHLATVPVFLVGFLVLVGVNSSGMVPASVLDPIRSATPILFTASLAALGLGTDFGKLRRKGLRPLLLCGASSLFIASLGYTLVVLQS